MDAMEPGEHLLDRAFGQLGLARQGLDVVDVQLVVNVFEKFGGPQVGFPGGGFPGGGFSGGNVNVDPRMAEELFQNFFGGMGGGAGGPDLGDLFGGGKRNKS